MSKYPTINVPLTRGQVVALQGILLEYIRMPDTVEVSIDILSGEETTTAELLVMFVNLVADGRYSF